MARPPHNFNEFIGQPRIVRHLKRLIAGAKALGKPCPSLLLMAPSGWGKTSLARAIAAEYGSDLHVLLAGEDTRAADLCGKLRELNYADILFIDEAHSLNRDAQQVLYSALDDRKIPALHRERLKRAELHSIADFTLILATNCPGQIATGLRNRLTRLEFDTYAVLELKAIAERVAAQMGLQITPQAARRLAEVAQGTPRLICRRLEGLRLLRPRVDKVTQEDVEELLAEEGIDAWGLWPSQRVYLRALAASPGGASSLERLALKLGCDAAFVRQEIEPYLIDQGLVDPHTSRGRKLTSKGELLIKEIAREITAEEAQAC